MFTKSKFIKLLQSGEKNAVEFADKMQAAFCKYDAACSKIDNDQHTTAEVKKMLLGNTESFFKVDFAGVSADVFRKNIEINTAKKTASKDTPNNESDAEKSIELQSRIIEAMEDKTIAEKKAYFEDIRKTMIKK